MLVCARYRPFLAEALALGGYADPQERERQMMEIYLNIWSFLPLLHRVSDFEHLLVASLIQLEDGPDPIEVDHLFLPRIKVPERLAIVMQELEDWGYGWGSLALRMSPRRFAQLLCRARCRLMGFDPDRQEQVMNQVDKRDALESISMDLDQQSPVKRKTKLCRQICAQPDLRFFKTGWLDLRCHLIEWRQDIRNSHQADEARFWKNLEIRLPAQPMRKPLWKDRLVSRFNFPQVLSTSLSYS